MAYEVKFSKNAKKSYEKLPANIRTRIDKKLDYLRITPRGNDTIMLSGEINTFRTRVGSYRIVYEIHEDKLVVWILDVDHRKDVYRG
ncbi:MAG: type II toxin-antitoxin system RelE/ParE family toxin [Gammaproteobacteria bacterium]|nr:type II toxin-antitoxin system RelE/ParE family toxin [Gammaproteobacteria bacterium]